MAAQTVDLRTDPAAWLTRNLGGAACVVYQAGPSPLRLEHITENSEVRFDGCRMVLQQATVRGTRSTVQTFEIPLASLDATTVTIREGFDLPAGWTSTGDVPTHTIRIAVSAGQPLIDGRMESFDGVAPTTYRTKIVDIPVRHLENADQIVLALTQAIEGCTRR